MPAARPAPATGSAFVDARGDGHALRVTWHAEAGLVVLSIWKDKGCAATVRLTPDQAVGVISILAAGLARGTDGPDASEVLGIA